jgi:spermidine synthase
VEVARQGFGPRIHDVFEDPRSRVVFDDAKTFFAASHERYDLIVSEPSNPWVSGVASLFSDEFYGHITQYLQPGGYFVQWIQLYETDVGVVASIVKALSAHFDTYRFYNLNDSDLLIVATRGAPLPPLSERVFQWPRMRADLERIGVRGVADLRARLIGDEKNLGPTLRAWGVPANSDFFPFVDINSPRLRYLQRTATELPRLGVLPVPFVELILGRPVPTATSEPDERSTLARDSLVRNALAVRAAVLTGNLGGVGSSTAGSLLLIDLSAARCSATDGAALWRSAARRISDLTAAFLSPSELEDIWDRVRSSPCYREVAGEHRAWVDLFAAIAGRDSTQIAHLATQLLASGSQRPAEEVSYLTMIAAAADVRLGERAQAADLLAAQRSRLDLDVEYELPLRELLVLAHTPETGTLARSSSAH